MRVTGRQASYAIAAFMLIMAILEYLADDSTASFILLAFAVLIAWGEDLKAKLSSHE